MNGRLEVHSRAGGAVQPSLLLIAVRPVDPTDVGLTGLPDGYKQIPRRGLGRRDREPFAALGATPLEYETAVLRRHPH